MFICYFKIVSWDLLNPIVGPVSHIDLIMCTGFAGIYGSEDM